MAEDDHCQVCDLPKSLHTRERVNHQFSPDGQLRPWPSEGTPKPRRTDVTLGRLIGILSNKGILTPEEVGRLISEDGS